MTQLQLTSLIIDLIILLVPSLVVLTLLKLRVPRVSAFNLGASSWVLMLVLMHYVGKYLGITHTYLFLSNTNSSLINDVGIGMLSAIVVIALNEFTRIIIKK